MNNGIIATLACIGILSGCSPIKDGVMIERFKQNKPVLETLVRMAGEDKLNSSLWSSRPTEKPETMSGSRALEYQRLLKQAGVTGIGVYDAGTTKARIVFFTEGPFLGVEEKSFVHSVSQLAPLLESLDKGRKEFKPYVSYYRRIEGSWYLEYAIVNG